MANTIEANLVIKPVGGSGATGGGSSSGSNETITETKSKNKSVGDIAKNIPGLIGKIGLFIGSAAAVAVALKALDDTLGISNKLAEIRDDKIEEVKDGLNKFAEFIGLKEEEQKLVLEEQSEEFQKTVGDMNAAVTSSERELGLFWSQVQASTEAQALMEGTLTNTDVQLRLLNDSIFKASDSIGGPSGFSETTKLVNKNLLEMANAALQAKDKLVSISGAKIKEMSDKAASSGRAQISNEDGREIVVGPKGQAFVERADGGYDFFIPPGRTPLGGSRIDNVNETSS